MDVIRNRDSDVATGPQRLPAGVVEGAVIQEIRTLLRTPEIAVRTIAAVRQQGPELNERDVIVVLNDFDALWGSLFPAEQARIVHLLVQRVSVSSEGIAVDLRTEGLGSVVREMNHAAHRKGHCMTSTPDTIRVFIPMDSPAFCRRPMWKLQNRGAKIRTCCVPLPVPGVGDARLRRARLRPSMHCRRRKGLGAVCQPHDALGVSLAYRFGEARHPPPGMLPLDQGSHRRGRAAVV